MLQRSSRLPETLLGLGAKKFCIVHDVKFLFQIIPAELFGGLVGSFKLCQALLGFGKSVIPGLMG